MLDRQATNVLQPGVARQFGEQLGEGASWDLKSVGCGIDRGFVKEVSRQGFNVQRDGGAFV